MSTRTNFVLKNFAVLFVSLFAFVLLSSFTIHNQSNSEENYLVNFDGTLLHSQAKAFLADIYQIPLNQVTASYCCQLADGRYKYQCTIPTKSTNVLFTVIQGQIIGGDEEGY